MMKKILIAAALALPMAAMAAPPPSGNSTPGGGKVVTAPVVVSASGKNQSDYKAQMALCQKQAQGLAGKAKENAIHACMHK